MASDPWADDDWTRAVAAVVDPDGAVRGTAFFVAPDAALTCLHVVRGAPSRRFTLRTVGGAAEEAVLDDDQDEDLDLVLLRVAARERRPWLTLTDGASERGAIRSHGFPRDRHPDRYPEGFPMTPAGVAGRTVMVFRGIRAGLMVLDAAAVEQGMSGAPAVDETTGAVVGVLRLAERSRDAAFAVPTALVRERWPLPVDRAEAPSFDTLSEKSVISEPIRRGMWDRFDPGRLHCVVVDSEGETSADPERTLSDLVLEVFADPQAADVWSAFGRAWRGQALVQDGRPRSMPASYRRENVDVVAASVLDVFANRPSLNAAVRLVVEADLVLFDVTGFEPGIMLLLGMRAATRRGITVVSHGGGWFEGEPLTRPFNLVDLSVSSHTMPQGYLVGDDPRIPRLVARIANGFVNLRRHAYYRDLPVYDDLRQWTPERDAGSSIPLEEEVLVLCSYQREYGPRWSRLSRAIGNAFPAEGHARPKIRRLQDIATAQLVSQSLYERIRRCTGCIADWSGGSPSTFFEIGVRIMVSQWSLAQVVSRDWTPEVGARQLGLMRGLLSPLEYTDDDLVALGERAVRQLLGTIDLGAEYMGHGLRHIAASALGRTERCTTGLVEQLSSEADALNHTDRVRQDVPQALFYEVHEIKRDQELAALERRVAAWLYLEHRVRAGDRAEDDEQKALWRDLGMLVAADLTATGDDDDLVLAREIAGRVG